MANVTESKSIEDRLISALQGDEFVLYDQTILPLDPQHGEQPFQEIFVRFKEEDAKLIPPGSFFPVLEEYSLLPYLDRWVVNRLARWVRGALNIKPDWEIPRSNVNLSDATLVDPTFGQYVLKYVDDSYLSEGSLAFEIAWDSAIAQTESLQNLIAELRPHNCSFTLAGFDGSETSFSVLNAVEPEFVKINPEITGQIDSVPAIADKVAEINRRCHQLKIKTIAEQVENSQVLEHLRRAKTDFAQGFELSQVKPL